MKPLKVTFLQGQGRLQLIHTISLLKTTNIKITYVTGWLPKNLPPKLVDSLGKIVGKNNLYNRLMVRQPKNVQDDEIISLAKSEFFFWFLIILSKLKLVSKDFALTKGWLSYSKASIKHLNNTDIVHIRSGAGQANVIKKCKSKGIITVVDHSIAFPDSIKDYLINEYNKFGVGFEGDKEKKFWELVKSDCLDADYVLVNSDFVKETFLNYNFNPEKIKIIYLGVKKDFFAKKKDWQTKANKPIKLLFIGEFGFRKGAHILIETINILNEENFNVELLVYGGVDEIEILKSKLNIPNNIKFMGTVTYDQLPNIYKDADIYVFPTFAEGSSRAVMESMAIGLPVITTKNCGSPITHGETGIIVPVGNSKILSNEIKSLACDLTKRQIIGTAASMLIQNNFTEEHYLKNLVEFYNDISLSQILN